MKRSRDILRGIYIREIILWVIQGAITNAAPLDSNWWVLVWMWLRDRTRVLLPSRSRQGFRVRSVVVRILGVPEFLARHGYVQGGKNPRKTLKVWRSRGKAWRSRGKQDPKQRAFRKTNGYTRQWKHARRDTWCHITSAWPSFCYRNSRKRLHWNA